MEWAVRYKRNRRVKIDIATTPCITTHVGWVLGGARGVCTIGKKMANCGWIFDFCFCFCKTTVYCKEYYCYLVELTLQRESCVTSSFPQTLPPSFLRSCEIQRRFSLDVNFYSFPWPLAFVLSSGRYEIHFCNLH